ncbi:MAG: inositol monophosphatase [Rhodospirillales bacterium]|nr:inositol monophosphatase [Rhodospirillales bacterium]
MAATRSPIFNVMERAARKAARSLVHDFGEVENLQVSRKGPADFVSTADLQAERILRAELEKARSNYGFLMEESGESAGGDGRHRWLVDPLDGTTNFLHSIPHFCISIALQRDAEIVAGLIYDPLRDEMFFAEKGIGAFVNDRRLRVSARREIADAVIATGIPFRERGDHPSYLKMLAAVMGATAGVRRFGAAALDLAYVAAGRFDGFFEIGLSPWDIAAGLLIVREAGGFAGEIDGGRDELKSGNVLVGNTALYEPLGRLLRGAGSPASAAKTG